MIILFFKLLIFLVILLSNDLCLCEISDFFEDQLRRVLDFLLSFYIDDCLIGSNFPIFIYFIARNSLMFNDFPKLITSILLVLFL